MRATQWGGVGDGRRRLPVTAARQRTAGEVLLAVRFCMQKGESVCEGRGGGWDTLAYDVLAAQTEDGDRERERDAAAESVAPGAGGQVLSVSVSDRCQACDCSFCNPTRQDI